MNENQAEDFLAHAITGRMDSVEVRRAQLELERQTLLTRLQTLIGRIEGRTIDIAEAADHDMSPTKSEENRVYHEIVNLLEDIRLEHGAKIEQINETEKKLAHIKVRIESLEAAMPGAEN